MNDCSIRNFCARNFRASFCIRKLFYTEKKQITVALTVRYSEYEYLIQNSQAVKKVCGPQKGYGEKRCEIQGGGQEMAVMVG